MRTGGQGKLHISRLWEFIFGTAADYQIESANNFWERIFKGGLIYNGFGSRIPLFVSLEILLLLFIVLLSNSLKKINFLAPVISLGLGNLLYVVLMLLLYQSQFSEDEAIELAAFDRYMRTFAIATFATLVFFVLNFLINFSSEQASLVNPGKRKLFPIVQITLFSLFLVLSVQSEGYQSLVPPGTNNSKSQQYQPKAGRIMSNTELGSNIFIVSELDRAALYLGYHIFQHNNLYWRYSVAQAWERPLQGVFFNEKDISWGQALTAEDQISPEQFHSSFLKANVEYLYLDNYDEYFAKTYGNMFPNFGEGRLYLVTKSGFAWIA
jgi:hypothetical protein